MGTPHQVGILGLAEELSREKFGSLPVLHDQAGHAAARDFLLEGVRRGSRRRPWDNALLEGDDG